MKNTTVVMPPSFCLKCGYFVDAATDAFGKKLRPRPGDATICLNCGALQKFNDDLRIVPVSEEQALEGLTPDRRAKIRFAQRLIRARGPLPSNETRQ